MSAFPTFADRHIAARAAVTAEVRRAARVRADAISIGGPLPIEIQCLPAQLDFMTDERTKLLAYIGGIGAGKRLSLDTPLATPTGWTTMGEVKVGDEVFDEEGRPCRVTCVSPVNLGDSYRVEFSDGSCILADAEHLWVTSTHAERKSRPRIPHSGIRTTIDIAASLRHRRMANHAVENAKPLQTQKRDFWIDPYVLGVWLGDGDGKEGNITVGIGDEFTMQEVERCGYRAVRLKTPPGKAYHIRLEWLHSRLRRLGLLGNKHIPRGYFRGSTEQRLAILQGLMDTDGTMGRSEASFYSMTEALADGVYELVVSLGMKATRRLKRARIGDKSYGMCQVVSFVPTVPVFRMPRKLAKQRFGVERESRRTRRYITAVVKVPSVPMRCISVDSPRRMYLAGRQMVPTHNSWVLMRWAYSEMVHEAGTGTVGAILANTYQQLAQSTLPKLWEFFDEIGFEYGRDYVYNELPPRHWQGFRSAFKKTHNTVLSVRGVGQAVIRSLENTDNLRGVEFGWIAHDESRGAKRVSFDVVMGRLRCVKAKRLRYRTTTSPNGFDWLYEEFVEKKPAFAHERRMINAPTRENFFLPAGYLQSLEGLYDPKFAQQELEGKFVPLNRGMVYHCFDRSVHLDDKLLPDPNLDWHISFDFNRTPFCVVLCQVGPHPSIPGVKELRVVDEVRMFETGTDSVCQEIIERRLAGFDSKMIRIYGDASGSQRSTKSNRSDYDIITEQFGARYGGRLVRAWRSSNPPQIDRINAVNAMLKNSAGQVRTRISSAPDPRDPREQRCKYLRQDLERVQFTPGSRQIHKGTTPEEKLLTHLCLHGDTRVAVRTGAVRIADLPEKGEVRGFDGQFVPYVECGLTKRATKVVRVLLDTGKEIVCTPDHRFLTARGWVTAALLRGELLFNWQLGYQCAEPTPDVPANRKTIAEYAVRVMNAKVRNPDLAATVRDVSAVGLADVYCLKVPGDGCFALAADGVVVSNSDALGYLVVEEFPIRRMGAAMVNL